MSNITLTIPNDDHIALRAFGKALEEMALAHGAEPRKTVGELSYKLNIDTSEATAALERLNDVITEHPHVEIDTTTQQVESLAALDNDLPIITVNATCHALSNEELHERGFDSTGTPWDERIHSASKALNADGTWRLRRKPKDMNELEWSDYVSMIKADLQYPVECGGEGEEIDEPTREEVDELIEASNKMLEPPVTHQNPVYMYQESRNVYALGRSEEEIAEYETKGYVRHTQEQYDAWEGPTVADEGDDFHAVAGIPPLPVPQLGGSSSHSSQSTPYKLVGSGDDLSSGSGIPVPPPVVVAPPVTEWDFPRLMTFLTERHGKIDVATVNTLLAQDGMSSVQELNAHPDKIGPFVARVKAHLGE